MLERIQSQSLLQTLGISRRVFLRGTDRTLADWAIVDDYNQVLDLSCRSNQLLKSLLEKYRIRACGLVDSPEKAREMQESGTQAEFICGRKTDIPWKDETFDNILFQIGSHSGDADENVFREAYRTLKTGGQFLMALEGWPQWILRAADAAGMTDGSEASSFKKIFTVMENAGFDDVSIRIARPRVSIVMGWKKYNGD